MLSNIALKGEGDALEIEVQAKRRLAVEYLGLNAKRK